MVLTCAAMRAVADGKMSLPCRRLNERVRELELGHRQYTRMSSCTQYVRLSWTRVQAHPQMPQIDIYTKAARVLLHNSHKRLDRPHYYHPPAQPQGRPTIGHCDQSCIHNDSQSTPPQWFWLSMTGHTATYHSQHSPLVHDKDKETMTRRHRTAAPAPPVNHIARKTQCLC